MNDFKNTYGPWAVVTGASDGIGRAFVKVLAAHKINLVLVARRREVLEALAEEVKAQHQVETKVVTADLALREGNQAVIEATLMLDVGLFVAAAGLGTSGPFIDGELATELHMIDVNCRSVTELTHHFANRFKMRSKGGIVLMSSILGFQGVPQAAHYAATKAYIQSLAEGLRVELKAHGIAVIASAPGPVASGFPKRANMQMGNTEKPATVAEQTLKALGKQTTVHPGWLAKFLGYSLAVLPRWGRVKVLARAMKGMTQHQRQ